MTTKSNRSVTQGPRCGARRRGSASAARLLDEALLLEPRGRHVLVVLFVDGHLLVHVVQLALGELPADRFEQPLERAVVLLRERVTADRCDVARDLQRLVVIEQPEILRDDARILREEQPNTDLLSPEG